MRKSTAIVGMLALLGSASSLAMTVSVVPGASAIITTPCCTATVAPSANFSVTLHVASAPGDGSTTGTTGATLLVQYDGAHVALTGAVLSAGSPFDFVSPLAPQSAGSCPAGVTYSCSLLSFLRSAAGYGSGTFDAVQLNFTALASEGPAGINIYDDGIDNSWSDQDALPIATTYNQANVSVVPVPAAAWLVAPAILAAGRFARRRKAA